MKVRALITLLLVCCLGAAPAAAGARFAERDARGQLTAEEEREAREFAEALFKRLEGEQNVAPLLEEMFVGDFAERLHASVASAGSSYLLDHTVAAQATRDEVLRHHVSVSNLILLTSLYMMDAQLKARAEKRAAKANERGREGKAEEEGGAEEEEEEGEDPSKLADIFPPDVLELFRRDPLIGHFVIAEEAREAAPPQADAPGGAGAAPPQQGAGSDEEEFISTVEQLRAFTSTVERANELLRKRLTSEQTKRVFDDWRRAAEKEDSELMRPHANVVTKEWYGYPGGTRIVCVNLLMFHVELVRVGSGYKVLAMYLLDD